MLDLLGYLNRKWKAFQRVIVGLPRLEKISMPRIIIKRARLSLEEAADLREKIRSAVEKIMYRLGTIEYEEIPSNEIKSHLMLAVESLSREYMEFVWTEGARDYPAVGFSKNNLGDLSISINKRTLYGEYHELREGSRLRQMGLSNNLEWEILSRITTSKFQDEYHFIDEKILRSIEEMASCCFKRVPILQENKLDFAPNIFRPPTDESGWKTFFEQLELNSSIAEYDSASREILEQYEDLGTKE